MLKDFQLLKSIQFHLEELLILLSLEDLKIKNNKQNQVILIPLYKNKYKLTYLILYILKTFINLTNLIEKFWY